MIHVPGRAASPSQAAVSGAPITRGPSGTVRQVEATSQLDSPVLAEENHPALTILRDYKILRKLGQGGMGAVYQAVHTRLNKTVAIKVLPNDRPHDTKAVARFEREMQAIGKLEHPNIVNAFDAGQEDGVHFLVMEYVDGPDLASVVVAGRLAIADACELIRQAALGLDHVHEHGLVHRDIKPSNLLLSASGHVKLVDLGLARSFNQPLAQDELTATGQVMGTVDYMAPEQGTGAHHVDIRADIYSLGCTLYKLIAGRAPFATEEFDSAIKKIYAHAERPIPPLREARPDAPTELEAIIQRMLAKNPAERPQRPADVALALAPFAIGANLQALIKRCHVSRAQVRVEVLTDRARAQGVTCSLTSARAGNQPTSQFERDRHDTGVTPYSRRLHRPLLLAVIPAAILIGGAATYAWVAGRSADEPAARAVASVPAATPDQRVAPVTHAKLDIILQRKWQEQGQYQIVGTGQEPLRSGDRVQLHAVLPRPAYAYLYWYNADGKPQRLWPDPGAPLNTQRAVTEVWSPPEATKQADSGWWPIEGSSGTEVALLAISQRPLSAAELAKFESTSASASLGGAPSLELSSSMPTASVSRGLGSRVSAAKTRLVSDFENELRSRFVMYHGWVLRHE